MNAAPVYLDSSAVLKLIFEEDETPGLVAFLADRPARVSSALARIEVMRVAARVDDQAVEREAHRVLRGISLIRIDDAVVAAAATVAPAGLRSLDAIHLATIQAFGPRISGIVTYDRRLATAARDRGIAVWAPP